MKGTSPLNCHNLELTAARSDFTDPLLTCACTCVCCGHTHVVAARIVYTLTSALALRGPLCAWRGSIWGLCSKPNGQPRWGRGTDWPVVQSTALSRGVSGASPGAPRSAE